MKKILKRLMIVVVAVICALSVHISVSASESDNRFPVNWEEISKWVSNLFGETTTAEDPDNGREPDNPTTTEPTTDPTTVENPLNPSVTGSGTVTTAPFTFDYPTAATPPNYNIFTTEEPTTIPEEDSSLSFNASLSDLFEDDTAALIVQNPTTEPFTLGVGLVVNNGDSDDFTWQKAALIAAAVLFVVLAALVVALIVQRSKKSKEDEKYVSVGDGSTDSSPSGPVPVEVMTPERIAELLGSVSSTPVSKTMTSEESAAAIKAAVLMGQLTHTYSDPLIRKYTDEPVMISPVASILDSDNLSGAQILQATDSMLDDITGNEKYASDVSGVDIPVSDLDELLSADDSKTKICPECNKPVAADDVFCHSCGNYVG